MILYIVRHGETNLNSKGVLQGWLDEPLNENGRILAHLTGKGLKDICFDYCISSPLKRARETAEIILHETHSDVIITYDDRIREISFGDMEGKELDSHQANVFFSDTFSYPQFPGGECVQMVIDRTQEFLKELVNRDDDKTYLISTHGCALRGMLNCLYDDPSDYWHGHVPYNCCMNIVAVHDGKMQLIGDDRIYYPQAMIKDWYKQSII